MTPALPQTASLAPELGEQSYAEQRAHTANRLKRLLDSRGCSAQMSRIADIGCGKGYWLRTFLDWGVRPQLASGIDLDPDRLRHAQAQARGANLMRADCRALPFADASVDIASQFTLFTSLLQPDARESAAKEMIRIVRPGGLIVWYDFFAPNPMNPRTRPVGREELTRLFPGCVMHVERVTFAAPVARMIARVSPRAAAIANQSDLLATHYLALISKNKEQGHV